ncbi:MAG: AraC family transcriptional regulator, partial [Chitinophagaceae bacterium]
MKVLPFTIPPSQDKTILIEEQVMPHFYPYLHRHSEMQLTLIVKGSGTLLVGSVMHAFRENEVYMIGADVPHVFKSHSGETEEEGSAHALTIFFNMKGRIASLLELPELKQVQSFLSAHPSGFRVPQQSFSDIADRIR